MVGKLPPDLLRELVLSRTGAGDPAVLVGPGIGEDAAVVDLGGGRVLVAHADPITGAVEYIGRLAVHVASNDVAARGVRPRWLLPVLQFPEGAGPDLIGSVTSQLDEAAREVGAAIVGGHSEVTPGLPRPMISMTAIGIGEGGRYVTTSGA
ncbi:MAG: hydrogenase assembly protein HupF, partial [Thaumarchaeota archaeon]|nr:hydrogenase assembly protein HupF [Nitrososphaerota archaeon]